MPKANLFILLIFANYQGIAQKISAKSGISYNTPMEAIYPLIAHKTLFLRTPLTKNLPILDTSVSLLYLYKYAENGLVIDSVGSDILNGFRIPGNSPDSTAWDEPVFPGALLVNNPADSISYQMASNSLKRFSRKTINRFITSYNSKKPVVRNFCQLSRPLYNEDRSIAFIQLYSNTGAQHGMSYTQSYLLKKNSKGWYLEGIIPD